MKISIHQPNYFPWLGYFFKIYQSEKFVLLDDVQYTKGGFTNRVRVLSSGTEKWLTVPVQVNFGNNINNVKPVDNKWKKSHKGLLFNIYKNSKSFKEVWNDIDNLYDNIPDSNLADINIYIVQYLVNKLHIECNISKSSDLNISSTSDDRLIEIIKKYTNNAIYLSGKGGFKYQSIEKFNNKGIVVEDLNFIHPVYKQNCDEFHKGLSILDVVFNIGWEESSNLIKINSK